MQQSTYTRISKKIGLTGSPMQPPSVDVAKALLKDVKLGKEDAFETVFRIHRFAISPVTALEELAMSIIYEAYTHGRSIFQ